MAEKVYTFRLVVRGRLKAADREDAARRVREGLCMSVPLHEAVDDLIITTDSWVDEANQRFQG
jgi:hypothetical protein